MISEITLKTELEEELAMRLTELTKNAKLSSDSYSEKEEASDEELFEENGLEDSRQVMLTQEISTFGESRFFKESNSDITEYGANDSYKQLK